MKQADYFRLSSDPPRMWTEAAHKSAKKVEAKFVKTASKEETKPGAKIKQVVEVFGDFTTPSQELSRNCPNPQFSLINCTVCKRFTTALFKPYYA